MIRLWLALALVGCDGSGAHPEAGRYDTDTSGWDTDTDTDVEQLMSTEHAPVRETCNGIDDDGDGLIDEDALVMPTWHHDGDGDGFGSGRDVVTACDPPDSSWVANGDDCDDTSALAYPGAQNDGICDNGIGDCTGDVGCRYEGGHFLGRARITWEVPPNGNISDLASSGDQDGDGRSDIALGPTGRDDPTALILHWSERDDVSLEGDQIVHISSVSEAAVDWEVSLANDVTGDGRPDVLISGLEVRSGEWSYWLADHLGESSTLTEAGPRLYPGFATNTSAGAGDVDGDGLADVLLGEVPSGSGRTALYLGEPGGVEEAPHAILDGEDNVVVVAGLGDTDGDGLADFAVGQENTSYADYGSGVVYIYTEAPSGDVTLGDGAAPVWGGFAERAGTSVAGAADVDGDGYGDVLVGSTMAAEEAYGYDNTVAAHLILGPVSGGALADVSAMTIDTPDHSQAIGRVTVEGLGDLDGDGLADFGVGSDVLHYHEGDGWLGGAVEVFYGPARRGVVDFDDADAWLYGDGVGSTIANAGDFDGDGGPDVAFAADNHLYLFLGQQP